MSDEAVISIVSVAVVFGAPMLWFLGDAFIKNWRQAKIAEQNVLLKREMIEKGYTAEEIERVIEAGVDPEDKPAKLVKR
jgi:hypothetical protein